MAKKEGYLDDVPDAEANPNGPVGATHAEPPPEQPPEGLGEAQDDSKALGTTPERPNPAKAADRPDGYVPEQSLREARDELKALKRQLRERDRYTGTLEERTNLILKRFMSEDEGKEQKANGKSSAPDPEKDIFGAVKHTMAEIERLRGGVGQVQQQSEQQRQVSQIRSAYIADANRYRAEKPDFDQAYNHMLTVRRQELQTLWGLNGEQLEAQIEADELQIAAAALQREQSPAEMVYQLAMTRGYQPNAQQVQQQTNGGPDLARIAKSQEKNRSLSLGAGAPSSGAIDARALARMDEKQFFELMSTKEGRKAVDRAMGLSSFN